MRFPTDDEIDTGLREFFQRNLRTLQNVPIIPRRQAQVEIQHLGLTPQIEKRVPEEVVAPPQQTYLAAPTITSVDPDHGPADGGNQVEIYGTGLNMNTVVTFGDGSAADDDELVLFADEDGTHLSVQMDEHDPSTFPLDVTVTNDPDADPPVLTDTLDAAYTFDYRPHILTFTPDTGSEYGGTVVALTGSHFDPDVVITFGGVPATDVVVTNGGHNVSCVTGVHAAGLVDVVATNPDGQSHTAATQFTYVILQLVSINAVEGRAGGGNYIHLFGTGFEAGNLVQIGGQNAPVTDMNAVEIVVQVPAGTGTGKDVKVTILNGTSSTLAGAYSYLPLGVEFSDTMVVDPDSIVEGVVTLVNLYALRSGFTLIDNYVGNCFLSVDYHGNTDTQLFISPNPAHFVNGHAQVNVLGTINQPPLVARTVSVHFTDIDNIFEDITDMDITKFS